MDDNEIIASFGEEFAASSVPEGMLRAVKFPTMMHVDKRTPDGRLIMSSGFTAENFPQSFMFQFAQTFGHDGAKTVGRVDRINIMKNGRVEGFGWLLDTPDGQMAALMISTKSQRGVSVDLSARKVEYNISKDGTKLEIDFIESALRGLTGVAKPAFPDAKASFADMTADDLQAAVAMLPEMLVCESGESDAWAEINVIDELAASATVLADLPASSFAKPVFTEATPVNVTPEGRVLGHMAQWGTCHIGIEGQCVTPPRSRSNYAGFATNKRRMDNGEEVWTAPLVLGAGHAPGHLSVADTVEFYGNACRAWADVAVGEDEFGIWISGQVRPGVTEADLHAAAMSAVSGHWKRVKGSMELIAILSVNAPGFPVPRTKAFADESGVFDLAAAGVIAPPVMDHPMMTELLNSVRELHETIANERAEREAQSILASLADPS